MSRSENLIGIDKKESDSIISDSNSPALLGR